MIASDIGDYSDTPILALNILSLEQARDIMLPVHTINEHICLIYKGSKQAFIHGGIGMKIIAGEEVVILAGI